MPKVTDLSGRVLEIAGSPALTIRDQAPPVNRVRYWNVVYQPCQHRAVLPHAGLIVWCAEPHKLPGCLECQDPTPNGLPADEPARAGEANAWLKCPAPPQKDPHEPVIVWQGPAIHTRDGEPPQPVDIRVWREANPPLGPIVAAEPVADLAPCGERLETYGKAEGLAEAQDLLAVVRHAATQAPRPASRQLPGMSHLGTPCDRKLAARILEGSPDRGPAWRPFVGTAVHEALEPHLVAAMPSEANPGAPRWLAGLTVEAGGSKGIIDGLDTLTGTLFDFKITGITKLRELWKGRLLPVYQGQLDLYALGLTLQGYQVTDVAVLALPMAGELEDAAWYSRPADLDNAQRLISRGWRIRAEVKSGRPLDAFQVAEDSCPYCPLFVRGDCAGVGKQVAPPKPTITWGG